MNPFIEKWIGLYYGELTNLPMLETKVYKALHSKQHVERLLHLYLVILKSQHGLDKCATDKIKFIIFNKLSDQHDPTECYQLILGHAAENEYLKAYYEIKSVFENMVKKEYDYCLVDMITWLVEFQKQEQKNRDQMIDNIKKDMKKNYSFEDVK